mmetsp:Transcript_3369/g.5093  ORF Transcript_3369/g.5093 Transcript_3369/m.5093 type:complete len:201 (-) Transcript_3369:115-717(-)
MDHDNGQNDSFSGGNSSGSETREQLHLLCKHLLLHAQFVFHDYNMISIEKEKEARKARVESKLIDYSVNGGGGGGMKRSSMTKKMVETPNILQSCVALGAKILFERKVRKVLQKLALRQKEKFPLTKLCVEWLPLSCFDSYSQLALSIGHEHTIDVSISQGGMVVTSFSDDGEFQMVNFESSEEFEMFAMMEIERVAKNV